MDIGVKPPPPEKVLLSAGPSAGSFALLGGFLFFLLAMKLSPQQVQEAVTPLLQMTGLVGLNPERAADGVILLATAIFAIAVIQQYAYYAFTKYTISENGIRIDEGMLVRHSRELVGDEIEAIAVSQGPVEALMGYGTLEIKGTGKSTVRLTFVPNPFEFMRVAQTVALPSKVATGDVSVV